MRTLNESGSDFEEQRRPGRRFEYVWMAVGVVVLCAVLGFTVWAAKRNHEGWEAFKVVNDCKKVAVVQGGERISPTVDTGVAMTPGSQVGVGTAPGTTGAFDEAKTAWSCKDGVTYWR